MGMMVIGQEPAARLNQHRVTSQRSPAQEAGAEKVEIPRIAATRAEWEKIRRPALMDTWKQILGKLEPNAEDRKWFHAVPLMREISRTETPHYTRIHLELALETDFWQPSLLLLPKKGRAPHPAVIAWTSTTPNWQEPEKWWGAWLAERGFVVLTGWSHIRNYRDGSSYSKQSAEKVYERFGRWAGLSRMVWDVGSRRRICGRAGISMVSGSDSWVFR